MFCWKAVAEKSAPTADCLSPLLWRQILLYKSLVLLSPIPLNTGHSWDKQMQPTALILLWQQDSGSSHRPRTLPDGTRLSQHSPLRLQPVYPQQRSQGAAMPTQPLAVVFSQCEGYNQQRQPKVAVKSSAFSFPAPVQKNKGAALEWFKPLTYPELCLVTQDIPHHCPSPAGMSLPLSMLSSI